MLMFMAFELNEKEISTIEALQEEFNQKWNELIALYPEPDEGFTDKQREAISQAKIQLNDEYYKKMHAIRIEAHERSLQYYASHLDELPATLQGEAINRVIFMVSLSKADNQTREADMWKNNVITSLSPYLELLKNNTPEAHKEVISFINYVFDNNKKVFQEAMIKATTRRAEIQKLETSKIGGLIFERSERNGFNNDMFYNHEEDQAPAICTGKAPRTKKNIYTLVSLEVEDLKKQGFDVPAISRLEPFDGEVLCSAISLYEKGNQYVTAEMLYCQMSGNKKEVKLTPQMREAIFTSLRKLRTTSITIYAEQELEAGYNKKARYQGVLLPSEILDEEIISLNGKEVKDCIHFFRNSPLYDYADGKNQISHIPTAMLDVPVNNTKEIIELKGYLLRRITEMRNTKSKLGNVIMYDTIFQYLKIDTENSNTLYDKKKKIRKRVRKILEEWQKRGYIEDFTEQKDGATVAKIIITL